MPIINPHSTNPLLDGRQSENAMLVRRGVQRLLLELGHAVAPELSLASGRRADLVALTRSGEIWIGPETRHLVAGVFDLEELGLREIRGKAEPVAVVALH